MPKDFKASQVRTNKIIASGSDTNPKLLIYPSSSAGDDFGSIINMPSTGSDGWLFISGGINNNEKTVFGGDATVSGSFVVGPRALDSLIYANVNTNPVLSRIGIKNNTPESTLHIGGTIDPALLVDSGAVINYGRNNASSATLLVQGKLGGDHGLLVVSGSVDRVSIGKHNPNAKLDVYGDGIYSGSLTVTASLEARNITGSIKYVDTTLTSQFVVGDGVSYYDPTGQWQVSGEAFSRSLQTPTWRGVTSGSGQTEIFIDSLTKRYSVPINSAQSYIILAHGRQIGGTAGSVGDSRWFRIEGAIKNISGLVSSIGLNTTYDDGDTGTSSWDVSLEADGTNSALIVKVTGETNKEIDWSIVAYPANNFARALTLDGQFNWYGATVDATGTEIFLDGISKRFPVKTNGNHTFSLICNGLSSTGDSRWFKIDGGIKNVSGVVTLVGSTTTYDDGDAGASTWDIGVTADDANDSLRISVTGSAATNIDWIVSGYISDADVQSVNFPNDTVIWQGVTTGSGYVELFNGGISDRFIVPDDRTLAYQIIAHGFQTSGNSGTTGDSHWFRINGAVKNVTGSVSLLGSNYIYDDSDAGASSWDIVVDGDDTNNSIRVRVLGESNKNIEWFIKGYITDITSLVGIGCGRPSGRGGQVQFNDGGVFGSDSLFSWNKYTSTLFAENITGSITKVSDGSDYLVAGSNITIATSSNGSITISSTGGGGDSYFSSTTAGSIYATGSTAFIGGEAGVDSPYDKGTDVFFYVSGSTDGNESSLFGGNLVISGSTQHLNNVQITGSLSVAGSLTDLQSSSVNISTTVSTSSVNIGSIGNSTNVVVAGDGKLQFLSNIGGLPFGTPPAGSIQLLAQTVGGVSFNPAGGEFVAESANGMVFNTNGHMKFQMNSFSNETLEIRSSNIFSSTPNILIRSDGNSATNSIDITSDNAGGISLGSNSSYDTGDILIGQQEYQRTIKLGNVNSVDQYVIIGSEFGNSYTAISGSAIITGNTTLGNSSTDTLVVSASLDSNIVPSLDSTYTLGTPNYRFAHVYTGDLHLRNDRGDWTMIEEDEYLTIRNNKTGKRYKLSMTPLDD